MWKPFNIPHGIKEFKDAEQYILKKYQKAIGERPYNWRKVERLSDELVKIREQLSLQSLSYKNTRVF